MWSNWILLLVVDLRRENLHSGGKVYTGVFSYVSQPTLKEDSYLLFMLFDENDKRSDIRLGAKGLFLKA